MSVFSKRSHEGYAMVDHRDSPGISPEFLRRHNIDAPAVPAGMFYESALVVCHCCGSDVVLEPRRTRERGYCRIHDAYLCDNCGAAQKAGAACVPYRQRLAEAYEMIIRGQQVSEI